MQNPITTHLETLSSIPTPSSGPMPSSVPNWDRQLRAMPLPQLLQPGMIPWWG